VVRVPSGEPTDPGPLTALLEAYNSGPPAVRVQGRLRVKGRGSADFGARAATGVGLRIDVVTGPFSSPALAVACRAKMGCEAYVPSRRRVYRDAEADWERWLGKLLRGRVPHAAQPDRAWVLPNGRRVLLLSGAAGWSVEVVFSSAAGLPLRVVLSRWEEPVAELTYADFFAVGKHAFPRNVAIRVQEPARAYAIEFRRVETGGNVNDRVFSLALPAGTTVEHTQGSTTWNETGIPFWLTTPDG
jgi:hypothetical protein